MPVNLRRREEQEARDAGSTEDFNWLKDFPLFTRGKCVLRVLSYSIKKCPVDIVDDDNAPPRKLQCLAYGAFLRPAALPCVCESQSGLFHRLLHWANHVRRSDCSLQPVVHDQEELTPRRLVPVFRSVLVRALHQGISFQFLW